ncbi:MAG TPA: TIGR04053 family radical SAM/SPASM domain-containing protein [Acidimicrobiales bacterium]|nr:TIGR04053 family radical SAM/SPASM domain-containing protein [Acidimicrobiales bacterium]
MRSETLDRALRRYDAAPHLVFWETTKACSLACRHCRATAQPEPSPDELSTAEGHALLDQIAGLDGAKPIVVFTGGDCLARVDIFELIGYAHDLGLRLGVAPSVTERLNLDSLTRLHGLGVRALSISLDGARPSTHDGLRGIAGHFNQTVAALETAVALGFRVQVNTTVMDTNVHELADVLSLLRKIGVTIWEVFFLVGVGRGSAVAEVSARDAEDVCHFLVDASALGVTVRTVEGPFFRRVQAERALLGAADPRSAFGLGELYTALRARLDQEPTPTVRPASSGTLATGDGRGVIFVGHDGAVHASGFLPRSLGNVTHESLGTIYTDHQFLAHLRAGALEGACGACEFSRLCGGSRARAFARRGRALGDDPACVRVPTHSIASAIVGVTLARARRGVRLSV